MGANGGCVAQMGLSRRERARAGAARSFALPRALVRDRERARVCLLHWGLQEGAGADAPA